MAAMIQPASTPVMNKTAPASRSSRKTLTNKPDDAALSHYLSSKLRLEHPQDTWASVAAAGGDVYQKHPQTPSYYYSHSTTTTPSSNAYNKHYPHHRRPRTASNTSRDSTHSSPVNIQKSSSTPYNHHANRSAQLLKQQQQQHFARSKQPKQPRPTIDPSMRPPSLSSSASSSVPSPAPSLESNGMRRSSITSVSSNLSQTTIRSDMSLNTKMSLSKRLRKVFSMSNLKSDLASVPEGTPGAIAPPAGPQRRRSFAGLSNLFQKKETDARQRSSQKDLQRLPPSTSSTSLHKQRDEFDELDLMNLPPASVGLHYGLPLHGSPRLRPSLGAQSSASSITSAASLGSATGSGGKKRRLHFCSTIQVHETFTATEYDRQCDQNATCQKLTPLLAMKIKQELNEYKLTEMDVHVDSRQYTHFFL
ncbi:hypothetical protein BCR43DRAFT_495278 [Syncephalastrum racemosum]|uniref:Uncharacterized protein n=1 Tax=Syncephalastrum racemosum TaxID=13706 RepID=A0A1X2H5L5_SYNRA|nr:hypothetical protein BCR43DRAFT_495278 [Syncephalastrum racemosum]